jgi:hypothetical protein
MASPYKNAKRLYVDNQGRKFIFVQKNNKLFKYYLDTETVVEATYYVSNA